MQRLIDASVLVERLNVTQGNDPEEITRLRTMAQEVSEEAADAGQVDEPLVEDITPEEDPKEPVVTAFLITQDRLGHWAAGIDISKVDRIVLDRVSNPNDFTPACAQVTADIGMMKIVQNTVQNVINAQMQVAQQAMAQQENAAIARGLQIPGIPRGRRG